MCNHCTVVTAELGELVVLAELEREVILAEADAGDNTAGAHRPLSGQERAAKVRFGDIGAAQDAAVESITAQLTGLQALIGGTILSTLFNGDKVTPEKAVAALTGLAATQPPTIRAAVEAA